MESKHHISNENTTPNIAKVSQSNHNQKYQQKIQNNTYQQRPPSPGVISSTPWNVYSPYITDGAFVNDVEYDPKYNLKNFLNVTENGQRKVIGVGSLATVYIGLNTIDNKYYAIKHMKKEELQGTTKMGVGVMREMQYQSRIYHPNIVRLLNVQETDRSYYYVIEYADSGSLFNYIRIRNYLKEDDAFRFFIQVVNAIYFLHCNNFIHRDLKPENLLVFDNKTVKLADFGWCCNLSEFQGARSTFCGTVEYMSPEIVGQQNYTKEIDVWSLGILLYEMLHGYSPFSSPSTGDDERHVIENIKLHKLNFAGHISKEAKELICRMLDPNPSTRIKVEEIFSSDFVKKYEKISFGIPEKVDLKIYRGKK